MASNALLTFVHTRLFDRMLASVPMSDEELQGVQAVLQANPHAGDLVKGTGGARKIRVGVKGRGKSGGARVLYYYAATDATIYLIAAYGKSRTSNLSAAGRAIIRTIIKEELQS
jgi:hypothetical protein